MNADEIKDVLVELGARRSDLKTINGWVSTRCLLATWQHQKRNDRMPSAGVSIGDQPIWNCFTCGGAKPFHAMIQQLAQYTGEDYGDLVEELEDQAYLGPRTLPDWDTLKQQNETEVLMPINESIFMDLYDSAAGHPYLRQRGISDRTARKLELLFDPEDPVDSEFGVGRVSRILFPVRGPDGALYGFSGRDTTGRSLVKARDYAGLKKAHCVLGAHLVAADKPKYVITVEGLFDYANGHECGEPACAVMHSSMTEAQAQIFRDFALPTYLFYDDDDAGDKGVNVASSLLVDYLSVMKIRYPEIWIENPEEENGGHYVKDPGELLAEEFAAMRQDASIIVPPQPVRYKTNKTIKRR